MTFIPPRKVPDRESKYMGQALILAAFSKDPYTQVGAVIVEDESNTPLGEGYNGPPSEIDDESFSWGRPDPNSDELSKYDLIHHAEKNAIKMTGRRTLEGCTLYCSAFPCKFCALDIVTAKVSKVVYLDYRSDANSILQGVRRLQSEQVFKKAKTKIELCEFNGDLSWLEKHLQDLKHKGIL